MAGWKPASAFNHDKAKFILTGKHTSVECQKCHAAIEVEPPQKTYVKFTGIKFEKCLDCHQDVHKNKFGQDCESCHNTSSWNSVNQVKFDHSKTKYPLEGKHVSVECSKCHLAGRPLTGLKFAACTDCHSDYHQGQLVGRTSKGACEECHTVTGYEIVKFSIDEYQKTKYPLMGSHLAIPCNGCHKKETLSGKTETIRLKFESTRCLVCHQDPHKGAVDQYTAKGGCEYCHLVDNWQANSFDHGQTKFALDGKHKDVSCRACHGTSKTEGAAQKFAGVSQDCQGCHEDIHRGQFAEITAVKAGGGNDTDCGRCHITASWKPEKFDHNRDSAFKLDGAHANVPCVDCHKQSTVDGKLFIKYKPLESTCSACHGEKMLQGGGGKS
jgi:hypothetical protein